MSFNNTSFGIFEANEDDFGFKKKRGLFRAIEMKFSLYFLGF